MTSEEAIREARAAYNLAIARHDADAIAAVLLANYVVITARNVVRHGREESRRSWTELFEVDPSASYVRTPERVSVNDEWGHALETGTWSGTVRIENGEASLDGVYAAKWVRTAGGAWLVASEVFTALSCRGAGELAVPPPEPPAT